MEEETKGYVIDGYLFATKEEAEMAQKELKGIRYLQRNNNLKDANVMLQVYQKLLAQGLFHTPVGMNYLKRLQESLIEKKVMENLPPIPVVDQGKEHKKAFTDMKKTMEQLNDVGGRYRRRFRIALALIAILAAGLVFMVSVAATTNQPNILNYEEKIINKYEYWEQELEQREQKLKEQGR